MHRDWEAVIQDTVSKEHVSDELSWWNNLKRVTGGKEYDDRGETLNKYLLTAAEVLACRSCWLEQQVIGGMIQ